MKGFGIEIKNNLLEPKHVDNMGESVWLYMLFLDKMTSINEDGIGLILGGRPIIFEEINQELGISERTYNRWMKKLKTGGYVNVKKTPTGLTVSVNKAFKKFGKTTNTAPPQTAEPRTNVAEPSDKCGGALTIQTQLDNNSMTTPLPPKGNAATSAAGEEIGEIFDVFKKTINPMVNFGHKTQRAAANELILKFGKVMVLKAATFAVHASGKQYAPVITNPYQLKIKWPELVAYKQRTLGKKIKKWTPTT